MGWDKVACWSTKAAISLKRVKIYEKLLWRAYRNLQLLFERYHPDPQRPPLPQDWGSQPYPKTAIDIISGTAKAAYFKFGRYIHMVYPNTST